MKLDKFIRFALIAFFAPFMLSSCYYTEEEPIANENTNLQDSPETRTFVDLGLPSGTLWSTRNVGAALPADKGVKVAWGEFNEKEGSYDWYNYLWCNGRSDNLKKYCTQSYYGLVDNLTTLEPADDAATVQWGDDWCMPTYEQIKELGNTNYVVWRKRTETDSEGNTVTGYLIESRRNGNSIFLQDVDYWSASLYTPDGASYGYEHYCYRAYYFNIKETSLGITYGSRYQGMYIRPVRKSK